MQFLKKIPGTLSMIIINLGVYAVIYMEAESHEEPLWSLGLLANGALYNPFTLNGEWERLFTSMFLHGSVFHLLFNMYGLFALGQDVETRMGTKKFLLVYFTTGLAAGVSSLYFNLFYSSVGASGALFGLFGFGFINNLVKNRHESWPILLNFIIFLVVTLILAEMLPVDNAAHLGGAVCGAVMAGLALTVKREWIVAPILVVMFFLLPKYQVHYFNFFQKVLEAQDSSNYVLDHGYGRPTDDFLKDYERVNHKWDSALNLLNAQTFVPAELQSDTFKIRRFIRFQKDQARYRIIMYGNESYIYFDSIGMARDSSRKYLSLDHVLNLKYTAPDTTQQEDPQSNLETVRIWYDSNWVQIPYPPAAYYRIGQRDSAGLWQGPLTDHYRNGNIQMKGTYKDDLKDGIFIYYNEDRSYSSAGIYRDDHHVGKWETFHPNGKIKTEEFYRDRYFLKSLWDSTGVQMVTDGNGREIQKYSNGVIAAEGEYVDGRQHGYWYGRHANGEMYFEENYNRGRLINGRSRSKAGRTFVYDESTLFALPEGGFNKLNEYIRTQTKDAKGSGTVKLTFRVTVAGQITDFKTEQSVSKELDMRARHIILSGPRWLPARLHGQERTDGLGFVSVEF